LTISPPPWKVEPHQGSLYALLAYTSWGLLPLYWKLFGSVSAIEILSHRMIWSALFLTSILIFQGRLRDVLNLRQSYSTVWLLLLTATLLTVNWGIYIYGVNSGQVVEASLGYYINPLVTVLLGLVILKEKLQPLQKCAVGLATIGVSYFIWHLGTVPWIALSLAVSFAIYGLVRKLMPVPPLLGLTLETWLISPLTLIIVLYLSSQGKGHFGQTLNLNLLFMGSGIATSLPLLWFNQAAKRLRLASVGFFQYLAPSISLCLGVFIFKEAFTLVHGVTFGCIWGALALYSLSSLR